MRNLVELRINFELYSENRIPPSNELILSFERAFNVVLPEDYVKLLMYSNGGYPFLNTFKPADDPDYGWYVSDFFYLREDQAGGSNLWEETLCSRKSNTECLLNLDEKQIPIAISGTGEYFILDTSTTPAKVFGAEREDNYELVELAPSFSDFIDGLIVDPEDLEDE